VLTAFSLVLSLLEALAGVAVDFQVNVVAAAQVRVVGQPERPPAGVPRDRPLQSAGGEDRGAEIVDDPAQVTGARTLPAT
jgi:hypothetical protein